METDIIRKAAGGDPRALTVLVNRHKELAYNVAYRIIQNAEDAKDVTQNAFLKAMENLGNFRQESKFSTWLYRIVYNEAMMLVRKRKRNLEFSDGTYVDIRQEEEVYTDQAAMQLALNKAIEKLEPRERAVIDLFYLGEKSVKEIHKITGMSTSNVKVVLHRTREKLKKNVDHG